MSDDRFGAKVEESLDPQIDGLAALEYLRNRLTKEFESLVGSSKDNGIKLSGDSANLTRKTLSEIRDAVHEHDLEPSNYSVSVFAPKDKFDLYASINYWPTVKTVSNFDVNISGTNRIQVQGAAEIVRSLVEKIKTGRANLDTGLATPAVIGPIQAAPETAPSTPQTLVTEKKVWWKGSLGWAAGIVGALFVAYVTYLLGWN
ncbi:hypothetical protein [Rathayibacter sp. VKM Ac-2857]|uniref:hypothetical protein n=1 Tax=Rathayibacter sp. VKM Ac-2857 TaxID=2739020 RepID=UPI0015679D14|nr:hypothetical protein [Rathayibacter sp. VKM Ac-2857]NQX15084.1 hypothetical protein [Rathayibacter sp. VKM Ac-2857]